MEQYNLYPLVLDIERLREFCLIHGKLVKFNKGDAFVEPGSVGRNFGIVVSGYFKYTTLNHRNEEAVANFAFKDELIGDFCNSYVGNKAVARIIAGTESTAYVIPFSKLKELAHDQYPDFESTAYEALFRMIYNRIYLLYRYSPEERYKMLIENYCDAIEQVALKDIASHLMISPTHLSRIRKKMGFNPI